MSDPVEIMGVIAYPNENGKRDCRFIDSDYNTLFYVPDRENIIMTDMNGGEKTLECRYIDDVHFAIGGRSYHICEFAEIQEQNGRLYRPEHPRESDCCDTYTIYQVKNTRDTSYSFMPYENAKNTLHPSHYEKAYQGVLAPKVTLDDLFLKHNRENRPFGWRMRSLSMSDVILLNRGGEQKAFYVDQLGFTETNRFLHPPKQVKKRKRSGPER